MKIRTKLLLALSALPIFLVILIVIGRIQVNNFEEISNTLERNYEHTILAESIHRDIKDEAISLRNITIFTNEDAVQTELAKLQTISSRIEDSISILKSNARTTDEKDLVNELINTNQAFNIYKNELINFVADGSKDEVIALMNEDSIELHRHFFELISEITTTFETNMSANFQTEEDSFKQSIFIESLILGIIIIIITIILLRTVWNLTSRLNRVSNVMSGIANGKADLNTKVEVIANDEIDEVAKSFNQMAASVEERRDREQELTWTKTNIAEITTSITAEKTVESLAVTFLSKVVPLVRGSHAVFYVVEENEDEADAIFTLRASYAFKERKHMTTAFRKGEGLIGQCAAEKSPIILSKVPADYVTVKSGLGESAALTLYLLPILFEGEVRGVVEIASFEAFGEKEQALLEEVFGDLGIILESVIGRIKQTKLLEETQMLMEEIQTQSEELQSQQDELKSTNEELEQQTIVLRQSEEKLQIQQEELEQTNTELEEKAISLEEQNRMFEEKNNELENAKAELEEKARQLASSSKYKSEFLANMSHELRTPLNSMLILSKLLSDNDAATLSPKQVEFAKTIHTSGKDLLALINDILDLSKIESGKMEVHPSNVSLSELTQAVESNFRPVANQKDLQFEVILDDSLPDTIYTDDAKLQQVLKNLLANAFKFTKKGKVTLEVSQNLNADRKSELVFSVKDTGIGIAKENLNLIFEAFQQADGTTSRKYGGTGLGLSISKEFAAILGGKIVARSEEGTGSTFSLYLSDYEGEKNQASIQETAASLETPRPKVSEESKQEVPFAEQPQPIEVNEHIKRVLIVDDDLNQRNSLMELIGDMDVIMKAVSSGREAIDELKRNKFDCLILDLGLTDTTGFDLLEKIMDNKEYEHLKVFIYTGKDVNLKEEHFLNKYTHTIIIKDQHSPNRLKEELALYLNEARSDVNVVEPAAINVPTDNAELKGKKVLLVDDDVRNVYALSSILEQYGMDIRFAENGFEGLNVLEEDASIDLIIMDIMMPEMDGYEAIERIREMPEYENHPIIALTAKAMVGDREKTLAAGASDYIVKPVDTDQLISLIKVWLFNQEGESNEND